MICVLIPYSTASFYLKNHFYTKTDIRIYVNLRSHISFNINKCIY